MPVLDQHRDNPAFIPDLRRKRSAHRVASTTSRIQKPTEDVARQPAADRSLTHDAIPDAGIAEVTSSLASMFSQGSPIPVDDVVDSHRPQRAPTADMMTDLSQHRRMEFAKRQNPPGASAQYAADPDHDMDDSSDDDTLPIVTSGKDASALQRARSMPSADLGPRAEPSASPEVPMSGTSDSSSLFVSALTTQAGPINSQAALGQTGPQVSQNTQFFNKLIDAEVAEIYARRDEEDPDFRPANSALVEMLPEVAAEPGAQPVSPDQGNVPCKRSSDEIRRETSKKSKAVQLDEGVKTPTRIKGWRFEKLTDPTKQERDSLIHKCEADWGESLPEVLPRSLWPRASDRITTLEARDWPNSLLKLLSQLAGLTPKRPEVAASAIRHAINKRMAWYSNEGWLMYINDDESAVELVLSGKVSGPTEEVLRVDSPSSSVTFPGSGPERLNVQDGAVPPQRGHEERGHSDPEEDLYDATPQPRGRLLVTLPVDETRIANVPQLHVARLEAGNAEYVDLTMDDANDEDAKSPISHHKDTAAQGGSIDELRPTMLPKGNEGESLDMIMSVSEDLSGFTVADMLKISRGAHKWHFKIDRALEGEGHMNSDLANVPVGDLFKFRHHVLDVQNWTEEEIKKRWMRPST